MVKKNKLNDFFYREWKDPNYKKRDYLIKKDMFRKISLLVTQ